MPRLLLICRHPYHLHRDDAQTWLAQEVRSVLRRDGLPGARLTRLRSPSSDASVDCEWLIEFRLEPGDNSKVFARDAAFRALLADLRLLGMTPSTILPDDRESIELRPS